MTRSDADGIGASQEAGRARPGARLAEDRPDVSIIVICWNVRDEVTRCLESVRLHAPPLDVETIVVDNGSTDGTAEAVGDRFPEAVVIRRPGNEGLPARNHGLRRARGRYRMFLDSDALLTDGALPTLVKVLEKDARIGLVGPRLTYADGRLQLSARRYPPLALPILRFPGLRGFFEGRSTIRRHLMADEAPRRRRVAYVLGACQLFRAEAQEAVGEIDERIWFGHDDADWCFRIRKAGFDIMYVPEAHVIHEYRRTTAARPFSKHTLRVLFAHAHFQRKWWRSRHEFQEDSGSVETEPSVAGGARLVDEPPSPC